MYISTLHNLSVFKENTKLAIGLSLDNAMGKVSNRNSTLVGLLSFALQCLGNNPTEFNLNCFSIHKQRIKSRQKIAENLKTESQPGVPLTIHLDGKLLEDICSKEIVDRLPVLISGVGVDPG